MFKFLAIMFIIKLYALIDIFKKNIVEKYSVVRNVDGYGKR